MQIVGQDKPSLDDISHFGTKGMKWGVRRDRKLTSQAANRGQSARKDRNLQVKIARRNISERQREINAIVRKSNKAKTAEERQKLDALATKKAKELFESPDQLTASRMTSGEKWVNGLLIGGSIAVAGAAGAISAF